MKSIGTLTMTLALAGLMTACGGSSIADGDLIPPLDGKADFGGQVKWGRIEFGGAQTGEFTMELEYHAYTFEAGAGAVFTLEITRTGSSRDLDTRLYLFGPFSTSEGTSGPLLESDRDSGYGALSKISEASVERTGKYTVVVGTAEGLGLGHYRLELTCEIESCRSSVAPLELEELELPDGVWDSFGSFEWEEYCYRHLNLYGYSDPSDPSLEQTAVGVRKAFLKDLYESGFYDPGLEEGVDELEDDESFFDEWDYVGQVSRETLSGGLSEYGIDLQLFEEKTGLDPAGYRIGRIFYSYECAPSANCGGPIYFLLSTDPQIVYVFNLGCGDE